MARKNQYKTSKFLTNRQGVRISRAKVKKYRNLARRSNYMLNKIKGRGDFFGYTTTGVSKFKSIEQLNAKIRQLEKRLKFSAEDYIRYRQGIMKDNYIKGLYNIYGEESFSAIDEISKLSDEKFYELYKSHYLPDVFAWDSEPLIAESWQKIQNELNFALSNVNSL